MTHSLPPNASLENLRKQAKSLLKQWRSGDPATLNRVRVSHPQFADATDSKLQAESAKLSDCQIVLAREFGFDSWAAMKRAIEATETELVDQLLTLGVINYYGPHALDIPRANELLSGNPQLSNANIWSAAAVGDAAAVGRFLDDEPSLVNRKGGPNDWEPLLYLCYSRISSTDTSHSALTTAALLLDRGADANGHYLVGEAYEFTCVTGAIGEGEAGVKMWPPHQHAMPLVTLLVERGADPNDGQGLYNSMFSGGTRWLRLLLDNGLTNKDLINWATDNRIPTVNYLLAQACKYNQFDRAELLLTHGADPNGRDWYGHRTCYELAIGRGNPEIAGLLVRHGAERVDAKTPQERFFNACMLADRDTVELIRSEQTVEEVASWISTDEAKTKLAAAAESNKDGAVRLMLELGFPIGAALFDAAWNGHLEIAQLLVDHGASPRQRHEAHVVTPIAFADRAGHMQLRNFLLDRDCDVFDAIDFDRPDRIEGILAEDPDTLERTFGDHAGCAQHERAALTPLAWAVSRGKENAARVLLKQGADATVQSPTGESLVQLAIDAGRDDIAELLRQANTTNPDLP